MENETLAISLCALQKTEAFTDFSMRKDDDHKPYLLYFLIYATNYTPCCLCSSTFSFQFNDSRIYLFFNFSVHEIRPTIPYTHTYSFTLLFGDNKAAS